MNYRQTQNFYNSSRLPCEVSKYQKISLLTPKGSSNFGTINFLSFFFIYLLSLGKQKNDPHLKIILTIIAFLVCILVDLQNLRKRLKSCFACQFFTHDIIEITNETRSTAPLDPWDLKVKE